MTYFILTELEEVFIIEDNLAADNNARRIGDKTHNGHSAHALAAGTLPDQSNALPLIDVVGDAINGSYLPFLSVEVGFEVFDFQQFLSDILLPHFAANLLSVS